jgi:hypothetical protein
MRQKSATQFAGIPISPGGGIELAMGTIEKVGRGKANENPQG